tara:strand:+ start:138 stop:821 length:684 start_codon:yes stop_codon:yes gene_type:complete
MNKKILVIAPHPDDEVLGAGGILAKSKKFGYKTKVLTICTNFAPPIEEKKLINSLKEAKKAHKILKVNESIFFNIPALTVDKVPTEILTSRIYNEIKNFNPSIVLIPFPDMHQDHKTVFNLCMAVTRPKGIGKKISLVACYEVPSATYYNAPQIEPNFYPNWNVDISYSIKKKTNALKEYKSTLHKNETARSTKAINSLASFRGSQVGFNYAESFYIIRQRSKDILY